MADIEFTSTGATQVGAPNTGQSRFVLQSVGRGTKVTGRTLFALVSGTQSTETASATRWGYGTTTLNLSHAGVGPRQYAPAAGGTRWSLMSRGYQATTTGRTTLRLVQDGYGYNEAVVVTPPVYETNDPTAYAESSLIVGSAARGGLTLVTTDGIAFRHRLRAEMQGEMQISEGLQMSDAASTVFMLLVQEGIVITDAATLTYNRVVRVVEKLLLSGQAKSFADALGMVQTSLVFGIVADAYAYESVRETLDINATVSDTWFAVGAVLEELLVSTAATSDYRMVALVQESLVAAAGPASKLDAATLVREAVSMAVHITLEDGSYTAWVMNTVSTGLSRYDNYPFNSFAKIGNNYFGATSTGLYELGGDTDAGRQIQSRVRLGLNALNTRLLKRIPECYVGYSSDGTMWFKAVTVNADSGLKQAAHYRMHPRPAGVLRENRVEFGKGLVSVDWDFIIENSEGCDFDLESIEFMPLNTSRRTRR